MQYLGRKIFSLFFFLAFYGLSTLAQTGGINGVVVDKTGAAIEGARVTVTSDRGETRANTFTKRDGTFAITGLAFGHYQVAAESRQFERKQIALDVTDTSPMPSVTLELRIGSVTQDITVTAATRSDVKIEDLPVSATIVTREEVQETAAQTLDELLLKVPGVNLQEPPSFAQHPTSNAVSMRGLGGERALVLLDGVPLNDAFFGYVQWNRVSMDSVERVEVVRGGASSLWGNYAMSGVINVVDKQPARNDFTFF